MRIHDIQDVDGRVLAFEVPSFFLDRRAVRQIVQAIPGATLLAYRPFKERLCEFKVGGVGFLVHEHWGESDRYWIRDTFARARPFLWFVRF